jgi:hypothetical protein
MNTSETTPALFHEGNGRTQVCMSVSRIGEDFVVCLFNEAGHIGAAAVADYSEKENRASVSVITRPGHREDALASDAARRLCKAFRRPVCVIAGIHLDGITKEEIDEILENCEKLISLARIFYGDSAARGAQVHGYKPIHGGPS